MRPFQVPFRPAALVLALPLALAACGPAVSSANFRSAAPRSPDRQIAIFATQLPTCPYDEIGVVRGKRRALASLQDVLATIQKRAREMGGDAIIGVGQTTNIQGGTAVDNFVTIESQEGLAGTVIRFRDPGCMQ